VSVDGYQISAIRNQEPAKSTGDQTDSEFADSEEGFLHSEPANGAGSPVGMTDFRWFMWWEDSTSAKSIFRRRSTEAKQDASPVIRQLLVSE
jgi:hypothetical protein